MLDYSDLSPFSANLTQDQARIVIDDVEAELARVAPTLLDSADPQVMRILRVAALRYNDYLRSGGRRSVFRERTRGPFMERDQVAPNDPATALVDIFTAVELQKLAELAQLENPTPAVASPVGQFPESAPYSYGIHPSPSTDYTYPPSGGIGWLAQ